MRPLRCYARSMTTLQIILPDDLARDVQQAGLPAPEAIESILRDKLNAQRTTKWQEIKAKLEADPIPEMTMEEINAEVKAVRAEKRRARRN